MKVSEKLKGVDLEIDWFWSGSLDPEYKVIGIINLPFIKEHIGFIHAHITLAVKVWFWTRLIDLKIASKIT